MSLAYFSAVLRSEIDGVWSVLGDFHGIATWVHRIRSAEPEGGTGRGPIGSVRRITLEPDGRQVRERLVHYDGPGRRYAYEFDGRQPFPVRAYRGTVHLLPVTESAGTFLEWYGEYDCDGALVDQLDGVFTGLYREFAADLRAHLGEPPPRADRHRGDQRSR